jgi:hypothetical protein
MYKGKYPIKVTPANDPPAGRVVKGALLSYWTEGSWIRIPARDKNFY